MPNGSEGDPNTVRTLTKRDAVRGDAVGIPEHVYLYEY